MVDPKVCGIPKPCDRAFEAFAQPVQAHVLRPPVEQLFCLVVGGPQTRDLAGWRSQALGVKPLGRLRGFAVAGVDPDIMGIGPVPAIQKLLAQTGLTIKDIDRFEINEAFAAQAVYCARELGVPDDRLNVNGGAIALGHPLGCTGAKLTATLLHELARSGGRYGIVSMCIGGGMGAAGLFESA